MGDAKSKCQRREPSVRIGFFLFFLHLGFWICFSVFYFHFCLFCVAVATGPKGASADGDDCADSTTVAKTLPPSSNGDYTGANLIFQNVSSNRFVSAVIGSVSQSHLPNSIPFRYIYLFLNIFEIIFWASRNLRFPFLPNLT